MNVQALNTEVTDGRKVLVSDFGLEPTVCCSTN